MAARTQRPARGGGKEGGRRPSDCASDAWGARTQVLPFNVPVAHQLMYMPQWDPNAESLVTGPSQDDHDGGPAAGVASGFDPSGGEPCYQFGNQWVSSPAWGLGMRIPDVLCCSAMKICIRDGLLCAKRAGVVDDNGTRARQRPKLFLCVVFVAVLVRFFVLVRCESLVAHANRFCRGISPACSCIRFCCASVPRGSCMLEANPSRASVAGGRVACYFLLCNRRLASGSP
jgi:hypothetical protein